MPEINYLNSMADKYNPTIVQFIIGNFKMQEVAVIEAVCPVPTIQQIRTDLLA